MALEVRIGVNPAVWMNDDLPWLGGETPIEVALAEGRRVGFEGFELGRKFPRQAGALRAALGAHGLACVSGGWSGRLAARPVAEEITAAEEHVRLLSENGAAVLVYGEAQDAIQGEAAVPLYKRPRFRGEEAWRSYGERLSAFGRHLLGRGLRLAYHPRAGAYVEAPEDVDRLMAATGPEVGLVLDTGQAVLGGGDPLELFRRHAGRICHLHLKDVRAAVLRLARNRAWSFPQVVLNGVFTVPGDGSLDFGGLLAALSQHGYRGWLVVEAEQDPAVAPAAAYAEKGYRHLSALLSSLAGAPRGTA